jgi:Na+-transporting NADH:ubiquinone oxidoreductase subunit NqrB
MAATCEHLDGRLDGRTFGLATRIGRGLARRIPYRDPRAMQLTALGAILAFGVMLHDPYLRPLQAVFALAAALTTHFAGNRLTGQPTGSIRSPLITALSVSILLRADSLWVHPAAAAAAIGSKYIIRARGRHLFNPSCFGVTLALAALPGVWISPGQWDNRIAIAGWLAVAGSLVVSRAARTDISAGFLACHGATLAARVLALGQPLAVLAHQMSSGAIILFAFFMLSDPRTIPAARGARLAHAAIVAAAIYALKFGFHLASAPLWALMITAPMVPLWDWLWAESDSQRNQRRKICIGIVS